MSTDKLFAGWKCKLANMELENESLFLKKNDGVGDGICSKPARVVVVFVSPSGKVRW